MKSYFTIPSRYEEGGSHESESLGDSLETAALPDFVNSESLDIEFHQVPRTNALAEPQLKAPLNILMSQSSRWKWLAIPAALVDFLPISMGLPQLTHLAVKDDTTMLGVCLDAFTRAPLLHSVSLDTSFVDRWDLRALPFQHITTFRARCYVDDFLNLHMPPLEHLEFFCIEAVDDNHGENRAIFPSLRSLTVAGFFQDDLIFSSLSFPLLCYLSLHGATFRSATPFCRMVIPCGGSIAKLSLEAIVFTKNEKEILGSMLAALPSVRVLHLSNITILQSLGHARDNFGPVLPKFLDFTLLPLLTDLHVQSDYVSPYDEQDIFQFLQSRTAHFQDQPGRAALQTIHLNLPNVPLLLMGSEDSFRNHGVDMEVIGVY